MVLTLGRRTLRFLFVLMVLFVLGQALTFLREVRVVATLVALSILLAYVISPAVNYLNHRRRFPRVLAILLVYCSLGLVGALGLAYILPVLKQQYLAFSSHIGDYVGNLRSNIGSLLERVRGTAPTFVVDALKNIDTETMNLGDLGGDLQNSVPRIVGGTLPGVFTGVKAAAGFLAACVLIPLFTFYILMDPDRYSQGFLRLVPLRFKPDAQQLITAIDRVLGSYIRGQLFVCLMVGSSIAVVLNLMRLEYATLIGVFAGVVDIIPYVGVALGLVPAFLIALVNHGLPWAIAVLVAMEAVHWTEGHIIVPNIVGHSIGLPPLTVMVALLAGAELGGIVGMVFAIPVAAILRVLLNFYISRLENSEEISIPDRQESLTRSTNDDTSSDGRPVNLGGDHRMAPSAIPAAD
jgi:predicted PurR-regulated permease PerM